MAAPCSGRCQRREGVGRGCQLCSVKGQPILAAEARPMRKAAPTAKPLLPDGLCAEPARSWQPCRSMCGAAVPGRQQHLRWLHAAACGDSPKPLLARLGAGRHAGSQEVKHASRPTFPFVSIAVNMSLVTCEWSPTVSWHMAASRSACRAVRASVDATTSSATTADRSAMQTNTPPRAAGER